LGKVLQETVETCFEKIGFRKDGENVSPMAANSTFATMDWDSRVPLPNPFPALFILGTVF
jgi:hypothetical protein